MAYDKTRPRDDDFVKQSAKLIRDNFEGLRTEGIVFPKPPLYGVGTPSATLGETFDRYMDTATGNEYYKSPDGWVRVTNLGSIYRTSAGVYYSTGTPDNSIGAVGDLCFGEGNLSQRVYIKEASGWVQKFLIPKGSEKYQDLGSVSGTKNINAANGTLAKLTIAGTTTITLTAALETGYGCTFRLLMRKGGAYTVNWPSSVAWSGGTAPIFSEIETDVVTLTTINGSDWIGTVAGATADEEEETGDTFVFTESGTITAPSWATRAIISGCGGGGGGGGTYSYQDYASGGGAGGGCLGYIAEIVPNTTYVITIGAGGVGGSAPSLSIGVTTGGNGGASNFDSILSFGGGRGGGSAIGASGASPVAFLVVDATTTFYTTTCGRGGYNAFGMSAVRTTTGAGLTPVRGYGAGGGPAFRTSGSGGLVGGAGAPGILIVRWLR